MTRSGEGDGASSARGVRTRASPLGFEETLQRILSAIEERGLRLFGVVDHDAAARDVGLALRPTRVVVFGSPAAGTPLMAESPLLALQLPARILVWQGEDGGVRLSYLTAEELAEQFGLDPQKAPPLSAPAALIDHVVGTG